MTRTTSHRRSARALTLAAGLLVALITLMTLGGAVAGTSTASASEAGASDESMAPVMIVLDASGSMNQTDAPGSRIDAAKTAVRTMVAGLPAAAQVGLTVYGTHTGSSDAEKTAGCQDITQLAPVGTVDKAALTTAVDGITAHGYTPIGTALQKAAAALPAEGPRAVVLVSDGEDTCSPPPPCDVAKQLKAQGVDLVVHTVGFKVDAAARTELSCIAQATGGTYSDAQDAGSLGTSLDQQVNRGLEPYDVTGKPVVGGTGPGDAPSLEPGQYTDTLGNAGDNYSRTGPGKYYAVDLQKGETPYLSATVIPPAEVSTNGGLGNALLANAILTTGSADGSDCTITQYGQSTSVARKLLTTTVVMAPGEVGGSSWPTGCPTAGRFYLEVSRNYGGDQPLPIELAFRLEPSADAAGLPGPADKGETVPLPTPSSDVTALAGGASFNSAPEVTPGATVSDTVVFGEDRYFKVHLDWGQQLAFRFDTAAVDGVTLTQGAQTRVYAANPVRQELSDVTGQTDVAYAFLGGGAGQLSGSSTVPVRWTNRQASDSAVQDYGIDGDYYLILTAGYSPADLTTTVPYTLTVDVTGTKETGPRYAQQPEPSTGPTGTGTGSRSAAGNGPSNGAPSDTPMPAAEPAGWTTQRTTVVGGAVGIAVLAAIVLGWLVLGRRRPRPATPPIMPPSRGPDRY